MELYMKQCNICKEDKDESEFGKHSASKDGLQLNCKICKGEYDRKYYREQSVSQKQRKQVCKQKRAESNKLKLDAYLEGNPCMSCGETSPDLLKFTNSSKRIVLSVRKLVAGGAPWGKIEGRINHCEVHCGWCLKAQKSGSGEYIDKLANQLGMNPSTASARLIKDILFEFLVSPKYTCFRCGEKLTRETFSVEHKIPWLNSEDPIELFFDLDNIAFSHLKCNSAAGRRSTKYSTPEEKRLARNTREREKWGALSKEEQRKLRRKKYLKNNK
jgi:hypothetical protein